jgi:hypothetical protein
LKATLTRDMRAVALVILLLAGTDVAAKDGPFSPGRMRISLGAGSTRWDGHSYWVFGGGFSVFVIEGLEVGAEVEQWFGSPSVTKLSPQLRYILPDLAISPYVGVFYRHWFIRGAGDLDSAGARAGVVYVSGNLFVGGGLVTESVFRGCASGCELLYPELVLAASF